MSSIQYQQLFEQLVSMGFDKEDIRNVLTTSHTVNDLDKLMDEILNQSAIKQHQANEPVPLTPAGPAPSKQPPQQKSNNAQMFLISEEDEKAMYRREMNSNPLLDDMPPPSTMQNHVHINNDDDYGVVVVADNNIHKYAASSYQGMDDINFDIFQTTDMRHAIDRLVECSKFFDRLDMNLDRDRAKLLHFLDAGYARYLLDDYDYLSAQAPKLKIAQQYKDKCDLYHCRSARRHHKQDELPMDFEDEKNEFLPDVEDSDDDNDDDEKYGGNSTYTSRAPRYRRGGTRLGSTHTATGGGSSGGGGARSDDGNTDWRFNFFQEKLDSVHCFLYHLYDVGLRVDEDEIISENDFTMPLYDDFSGYSEIDHRDRENSELKQSELETDEVVELQYGGANRFRGPSHAGSDVYDLQELVDPEFAQIRSAHQRRQSQFVQRKDTRTRELSTAITDQMLQRMNSKYMNGPHAKTEVDKNAVFAASKKVAVSVPPAAAGNVKPKPKPKPNKFNIMGDGQKKDMLMMDALEEHLKSSGFPEWCTDSLFDFLMRNEYDSDAIKEDMMIDDHRGVHDNEDDGKQPQQKMYGQQPLNANSDMNVGYYNLYEFCGRNEAIEVYDSLVQFMRTLSTTEFSIGYIFYYWDYFKELKRDKTQYFANTNDHSGYHPYQLYVQRKYPDIKQEVLQNTIHRLDMKAWEACHHNAQFYMRYSRKVRMMTSDDMDYQLYYGIPYGTPLNYENVVALSLYCNHTDIASSFSTTFRKQHAYESLFSVKARNAEYANWSRVLRETVQYYGQLGWYEPNGVEWNESNRRVKGPFYTGMNALMPMPQLNIRLCGPTSTSTLLTVAWRFANENGFVLQLNNNGYFHSQALRAFNCAWISNYKEEAEYLFMGGDHRIRVETIRHIKGCLNYSLWIEPLYYFDCMLNGTSMKRQQFVIKKTHFKQLQNLIEGQIGAAAATAPSSPLKKRKIPSYIQSTFATFARSKTELVINLHELNSYFQDHNLRYLVVEQNPQKLNVIRLDMLRLFRNCHHIILYTTNGNGQKVYSFDIDALLDVLNFVKFAVGNERYKAQTPQIQRHSGSRQLRKFKITIKATHKYKSKDGKHFEHRKVSWLSDLWENKKDFVSRFRSYGYDVEFDNYFQIGMISVLQDALTIF